MLLYANQEFSHAILSDSLIIQPGGTFFYILLNGQSLAGKDYTTHQMTVIILNGETEHEKDIEDWLTDIERMKDDIRKILL